MNKRYFLPGLPLGGAAIELPANEAAHAIRVMRAKIGERIEVFDGRGHEATAVIESISRMTCRVMAEPAVAVDREPARSVHLGVALPKPDRARELIERLTELGVASLTPLIADRSQRPPSPSLIEKLHRGVIEACKQSRRNRLLHIHSAITASDWFPAATAPKWIAHPVKAGASDERRGPGLEETLEGKTLEGKTLEENLSLAIGPEGGWTDNEVALAIQTGWAAMDLGPRIYRIETAAVVATCQALAGSHGF